MSDDATAKTEFFSWMLGEAVSGMKEVFQKKLEVQTIFLLDFVDSSYVEKYKLDADCLFILIKSSTCPIPAAETLKVTFRKMWTLDDKKVESLDLWNTLGNWQVVKFRRSIGCISNDIDTEKLHLEGRLAKLPPQPNEARLTYYVAELKKDFKMCWEAIEKEKSVAIKELSSDFEKSSLTKIFEKKNDWLVSQVCALDHGSFFVYKEFFKQVIKELIVEETMASIKKFCASVSEALKRVYIDRCVNRYTYLELLPGEIDKRTEKRFDSFLDECFKEVLKNTAQIKFDFGVHVDAFGLIYRETSRDEACRHIAETIELDMKHVLWYPGFHEDLVSKVDNFSKRDISQTIFLGSCDSLVPYIKSTEASLAEEAIVRKELTLLESAAKDLAALKDRIIASHNNEKRIKLDTAELH